MKTYFILILVAFTAFSFARLNQELPIGSALPNSSKKMPTAEGKEYSFEDVKQKNGLLVIFSCNTCPWVINNQQVAKEIANYALSKKIGVIVLNSNESQRNGDDAPDAMKQYALDQGYTYPYVMDHQSNMADLFGAKVTPECFLFDKNDKLVYHGAINDNPKTPGNATREHLKIAIDETISGKQVSVTNSRAMGCTIKRKS